MPEAATVLRLTDVVKTFPGVIALRGVSFDVRAGEVHALVGENGAGKSTLMAVAAGSTLPDSGSVEIGGEEMTNPSPARAQELGLAVVYQHLSVLEDLTVVENMVFAMPDRLRPSVARWTGWTRERLATIGAQINPAARVCELSLEERQLLEIAKALALESKVLILDEPTESLTRDEAERLFGRIRDITARGTAVVYISHRLPEVLAVAERITVLRDGEVRGTMQASAASEDEVLRLIVGRPVNQVFPEKGGSSPEQPALAVRGLSGPGFHDVGLEVRPGEIVGLAGVEGNGQREFLRALAGLVPATGELTLDGEGVRLGHPHASTGAGIVYLPGDRHTEGVFLHLSVRENISLLALPEISRWGVVSPARERRVVEQEIERLAIRTPSAETESSSLSGGNQQKLLFARSLLTDAEVLLADEPTHGVDAGARVEIYRLLRSAAAAGRAIVVLSTDVLELQGLCDRVLVFSRGQVVRVLDGEDITEEKITGAAITAQTGRKATAARTRRRLRARRFGSGDYLPSVVLALLILALGAYTTAHNGRFVSAFNVQSMLLFTSALVLLAIGQLIVMLTGGIDLSVGPLTGLVVVVWSFFVHSGQGGGDVALGTLAIIGVGLLAGLVNVTLMLVFRLGAVVATLATFIAIQGVSLLLRTEPDGFYSTGVMNGLHTTWGWLPVAFLAAIVLAAGAELILRFTRPGLQVRAVGSDAVRAHRLGARVTPTLVAAYLLCSLFAVAGGVMLGAQVGVGDPRVGVTYTLTSITAIVLGGASIFGGRGSFIGAVLGALLIQEILTSTTFLQIGIAWQYYLPGALILLGAGVYSRIRAGTLRLQAEPA
jgi:ribose transport system ATP-binding protein